jgi:hypothetical protein
MATTTTPMRPIRDVLYSRAFLKEVSNLVLFFATVSLAVGIVWMASSRGEINALADGFGALVNGAVNAGLGLWLRRGSRLALWVLIVLWALDLIVLAAVGPGKGLVYGLLGRAFIVYLCWKSIQRRRRVAAS